MDVPTGTSSTGGRSALDLLDDEFLSRQDDVARSLEDGRTDEAQQRYEGAAQLVVEDADGYRWHISAPTYRELKPLYRYRYTYRRGREGPLDRDPVAPRGRYVAKPSLARTYASRVRDGGFLRWLVLWSEPIGYAAGAAVAVGLWFLLGDLIGDLAEVAVLSLIVLAAAGLWAATWWLSGIQFREADRLSVATRLAAIGVTGWIPWVSTIGVEDLSSELRIAMSAATVLVLSAGVFRTHRGVLEYLAAAAAWMVFVPSVAAWIADITVDDADLDVVAVSSLVAAAAIAFPLTTREGERRWIPGVILALAALAAMGMLAFSEDSFGAIGNTVGIALGALAALSCWWSRRWMHVMLRGVHRWSSIGVAVVTTIVALAVGPWDVIWEWFEDVPLPVVLVVVGSIVLVAVAAAIRTAVRRAEGAGD